MLQRLQPAAWMTIVLVACTGLAGIAWQNTASASNPGLWQDTLPKEKKEKVEEDKTVINGDLDEAIEQVNRAKEDLEMQLQNKDWGKMHRHLEQQMKTLNTDIMEEQMAKAMKQIALQKMQAEQQVQAALKQIDWQKMQSQLQKELGESRYADDLLMKKNLQRAMEQTQKAMHEMKAVDMEKMERRLEKAKEDWKENEERTGAEIERVNRDIRKKDFRREIERAREGVNRASEELHNYKNMLAEMDKEGLLNARDAYNIEYRKGILIINGKTQAAGITDKYRHYFKKENVKIQKDKEDRKTIHL